MNMSNTNNEGNSKPQKLDDDLWEMLKWTHPLREKGISELKIAKALDVNRTSLNRTLRNKSWSKRSAVREAWLKRRHYLLKLDADGLLSLLEADENKDVGDEKKGTNNSTKTIENDGNSSSKRFASSEVNTQYQLPSIDVSGLAETEEVIVGHYASKSEEQQLFPLVDEPNGADINQEDTVLKPDEKDTGVTNGQGEAKNIDQENGDREREDSHQKGWIIEHIREGKTVEEVASLASAHVLNHIPYLTLEEAKEAAIEKIEGWNPANPNRNNLKYLSGDAPLLLWTGQEVSYQNEGARKVAFAPTLEWKDTLTYCAQEMRYGISSESRQRRYAVDAHDELKRGTLLGYRPCNWVPDKPYPDSDWFFGSEGNLRSDNTWWPSRAEALAYWYHLRAMFKAYEGTEAERNDSIWLKELEKTMIRMERFLLDKDYRMTFYYHGKGRVIPHHTRMAERRWMAERISDLANEIRLAHRRKRIRKILTAPFRWIARPLTRSFDIASSRRFETTQLEKAIARGRNKDIPSSKQDASKSSEAGVPILIEVEPEVCGELGWKALDPPWDRRDRTRWYKDGTGPLSPQGKMIKHRMQILDAS